MSKPLPSVYIFHGDDDQAIAHELNTLQAKASDPATAGMNLSLVDGRSASLDELSQVVGAMPFLADRRVVIWTNPLTAASSSSGHDKFIQLLDAVPPTTALVLVEHQILADGRYEEHWLLKWAHHAGERAYVKAFPLPSMDDMEGWICKQAVELGGVFTPQAAWTLTSLVGNDTMLAFQEINKLLTYVDWKRPVDTDDVNQLTVLVAEENIFSLMDAIGERNGEKSTALMARLLEQQEPAEIFFMIVRQFRLLLLAREALDKRLGMDRVAQTQRLKRFTIDRINAQAKRFSMSALESIYHRLLRYDQQIKTSEMEIVTVLQLLVAELCN
jgi:DNA polymerase-3 subunit delta